MHPFQAIVSAKRLNAFLSEQELPVTAIKKSKYQTDEYEATVFFENATLSWGNMKENLRDVNGFTLFQMRYKF